MPIAAPADPVQRHNRPGLHERLRGLQRHHDDRRFTESDGPQWQRLGAVVSDYFGSAHPSGMNAAFADGTVHLIPFSVALANFQNLCQINDGNTVTFDE